MQCDDGGMAIAAMHGLILDTIQLLGKFQVFCLVLYPRARIKNPTSAFLQKNEAKVSPEVQFQISNPTNPSMEVCEHCHGPCPFAMTHFMHKDLGETVTKTCRTVNSPGEEVMIPNGGAVNRNMVPLTPSGLMSLDTKVSHKSDLLL